MSLYMAFRGGGRTCHIGIPGVSISRCNCLAKPGNGLTITSRHRHCSDKDSTLELVLHNTHRCQRPVAPVEEMTRCRCSAKGQSPGREGGGTSWAVFPPCQSNRDRQAERPISTARSKATANQQSRTAKPRPISKAPSKSCARLTPVPCRGTGQVTDRCHVPFSTCLLLFTPFSMAPY
jgi:hypothetical protein